MKFIIIQLYKRLDQMQKNNIRRNNIEILHKIIKNEKIKMMYENDIVLEEHKKNKQTNTEDIHTENQPQTQEEFQIIFKEFFSPQLSIQSITNQMINELFRSYPQYLKYKFQTSKSESILVNSSIKCVDITTIQSNKSMQILFQKKLRKQILQDGQTIIYFPNGDIKQKFVNGTILHYFQAQKVYHMTLNSDVQIYKFEDNEVEIHFNHGKDIQIRNSDGTIQKKINLRSEMLRRQKERQTSRKLRRSCTDQSCKQEVFINCQCSMFCPENQNSWCQFHAHRNFYLIHIKQYLLSNIQKEVTCSICWDPIMIIPNNFHPFFRKSNFNYLSNNILKIIRRVRQSSQSKSLINQSLINQIENLNQIKRKFNQK